MNPAPLKVLVADDHPIVREGLRAVVATLPDFELTATAASGAEAVDLAAADPPDVVVMDLHMDDLDGVAATQQILAAHPRAAVLVLTMYEHDDMLIAALTAGARGYLLKGASHTDIARALRAVASGEAVFGSGVADQVLNRLTGRTSSTEPFPQLTQREHEVLVLLAQGLGTHNIAARLYLSPKTVRNHVANILAKLDLPDRAQAIAAARRAGLGSGVGRHPVPRQGTRAGRSSRRFPRSDAAAANPAPWSLARFMAGQSACGTTPSTMLWEGWFSSPSGGSHVRPSRSAD